MKIRIDENAKGYTLWLSANDTYRWANRPGSSWPCSDCSGERLAIVVDSNGLCDFTMNGRSADIDGTELEAIVSDHIPPSVRHLWPTWESPITA